MIQCQRNTKGKQQIFKTAVRLRYGVFVITFPVEIITAVNTVVNVQGVTPSWKMMFFISTKMSRGDAEEKNTTLKRSRNREITLRLFTMNNL